MDTLHDLIELDDINEDILQKYQISKKAEKLIKKLNKKQESLEQTIKKRKLPPDKTKEIKEQIFAIESSLPVLERFKKYFQKLERAMEGLKEKEKLEKLRNKYEEIKSLFISDLYNIMRVVGYGASAILASTIASMIILVLLTSPIPGTSPIFIAPSLVIIRKLKDIKTRVYNKKFEKEMEDLINKLESKKRKSLRSY